MKTCSLLTICTSDLHHAKRFSHRFNLPFVLVGLQDLFHPVREQKKRGNSMKTHFLEVQQHSKTVSRSNRNILCSIMLLTHLKVPALTGVWQPRTVEHKVRNLFWFFLINVFICFKVVCWIIWQYVISGNLPDLLSGLYPLLPPHGLKRAGEKRTLMHWTFLMKAYVWIWRYTAGVC